MNDHATLLLSRAQRRRGHLAAALLVGLLSATLPPVAWSACDLRVVAAGPALTNATYGVPAVGEPWHFKVDVALSGSLAAPFRIKWEIANKTFIGDSINIGPGAGYWWWIVLGMPLDGPIPWKVTLDPDNVTGDTNRSNNSLSGVFEPRLPTKAVETYNHRRMWGSVWNRVEFEPGSGQIGSLTFMFGQPTSHGCQRLISCETPPGAQRVITQPYGLPAFEIVRTNAPAGVYSDRVSFVLETADMRVNPTLLRAITWQQVDSDAAEWRIWTQPGHGIESDSAEVAGFVRESLPSDYRQRMTPYDVARKLHCSVAARLYYSSPPPAGGAVGALTHGTADCGGYSALLVAALRHVGIPARMIGGFRQGSNQWHVRVEFHLPGCEWIVADPTDGDGADPTGTYAYWFGQMMDNGRFFAAMDVGDRHIRPYLPNGYGLLQGPHWLWSGGADFVSYTAFTSLQPLTAVSVSPNRTNVILNLKNVPWEGALVVQSSTNGMKSWNTVTNALANGQDQTFTLPRGTAPSAVFRLHMIAP